MGTLDSLSTDRGLLYGQAPAHRRGDFDRDLGLGQLHAQVLEVAERADPHYLRVVPVQWAVDYQADRENGEHAERGDHALGSASHLQ